MSPSTLIDRLLNVGSCMLFGNLEWRFTICVKVSFWASLVLCRRCCDALPVIAPSDATLWLETMYLSHRARNSAKVWRGLHVSASALEATALLKVAGYQQGATFLMTKLTVTRKHHRLRSVCFCWPALCLSFRTVGSHWHLQISLDGQTAKELDRVARYVLWWQGERSIVRCSA